MTIIKNITLIAIFSVILFVQEQILSFLPNIQFTVFLIRCFISSAALLVNVMASIL